MKNLLAISVGNTRTRAGLFVDGSLASGAAADSAEPAALAGRIAALLPAGPDPDDAAVLLASVKPAVSDALVPLLEARLGRRVLRVERDVPIPIGRQLDRESIIGEDRLLNAAAAYDALKQACVVIDAGTAVTVDYVDGAGTFHGGAIGPGARMMLDAMHRGTAQLPEVALARPAEPIGHSTVEAMRAAVFHGLRGMVRELVEQYAQAVGSYPMVIATGGDAELLFEDYELVERIVPDLTLLGIAASFRAAGEDPGADDDE